MPTDGMKDSFEQLLDLMEDVLSDKTITFRRDFVEIAGSAAGSIFLSQSIYWMKVQKKAGKDGWFYKSREEWTEETGLTRYEQESARNALKKLRVLEEIRKGCPFQLHFTVNMKNLYLLLSAKSNKSHSVESTPHSAGNNRIDGGIPSGHSVENSQPYKEAEITAKSTSENTQESPSFNDSLFGEESNRKPKKYTRVLEKTCDPRCKAVTAKIFEAYKHFNKVNPGWGDACGKQLKNFLAAHPDWNEEKIFECIRNRFKSEVNPAQEPLSWINKLGDYSAGPLDKFGNPKTNGNGFHNGQQSRTNGSGATGHLLDHLPDAEENERRRIKADKELEEKRNSGFSVLDVRRNARGM